MFEVTADTAADYLRAARHATSSEPIEVRELDGGVSNVVLLVTLPARGERFVLKQARGKLRVEQEWLCPVERIWREIDVLRICGKLLDAGSEEPIAAAVPQILWEDRDNFLYAMTAAPADNSTWKEILLSGETQQSLGIARACGRLLAQLHSISWQDKTIAERLDDRTYFDQLRLDPYYRQVARVHADLEPQLASLISSVGQHRRCLVHGDFSPKNLLVSPGQVLLIDFEVGHYGDPAFDVGFFLTHLVLKSIWAGDRRYEYLRLITEFCTAYRSKLQPRVQNSEMSDLEGRTVSNLAACLLARVDGKSRVDYLSPAAQQYVRNVARAWLLTPPHNLETAIERLGSSP